VRADETTWDLDVDAIAGPLAPRAVVGITSEEFAKLLDEPLSG